MEAILPILPITMYIRIVCLCGQHFVDRQRISGSTGGAGCENKPSEFVDTRLYMRIFEPDVCQNSVPATVYTWPNFYEQYRTIDNLQTSENIVITDDTEQEVFIRSTTYSPAGSFIYI
jgi:hypothetical protein